MDFTKEHTRCGLSVTILRRVTTGICRTTHCFTAVTKEIEKGSYVFIGALPKPTAPPFGIVEDPLCQMIVHTERVNRIADWYGIDFSHQFADQLFLSSEGSMGFDGSCGDHRIMQWLLETDVIELLVGQQDQLFAERLQRLEFPLARGLAGL